MCSEATPLSWRRETQVATFVKRGDLVNWLPRAGFSVSDGLEVVLLEVVGDLLAGLGRKDEAIREAQRAVDLTPIAKDPLERTYAVVNLALVYAWTGERDRALEQLEIVAAIPAGPTYGDLLLNPRWDSLRGDPRFDKIVAAAKAASR